MALLIKGEEVEAAVRTALARNGYVVKNAPRRHGETGADIIAEKGDMKLAIECIGFQKVPPLRSRMFYEIFFRAISRLKDGCQKCVMALPERFGRGLYRRAQQYGEGWSRISHAFPELEIWLIDTKNQTYDAYHWGFWLKGRTSATTKADVWEPRKIGRPRAEKKYAPKPGTIGNLVARSFEENPLISYEEMRGKVLENFPSSKFNKHHFSWYKRRLRR